MDDLKFVNSPDAIIAYKILGSGEPLIMCTGFASTMDLWSTELIKILQEYFTLILFDYRGVGYSKNLSGSFSINTLADDVHTILNKLNIEKTNVLGWSMGGFVAQMFAINHSERVHRLILYATNCGGTKTINPADNVSNILSNPFSSPLELINTLFPDSWLALHKRPWKYLPNVQESFNPETLKLQYEAVQDWLKLGGGSETLLNKLQIPVLIICGKEDKVVPCENSYVLSQLINSPILSVIEGTGHGLMYQLPEFFAKNIVNFLFK
ncbi:MAG: alpha/beta hydrolase [Ignavibacteria bacterium]